ncbi:hypothetical protein CJU81_13775 [Pseudomonas fragi]|uniref:Response regulator n=1 Tax=Pseudomonas fragi TaxID=296 RepID=A0A267ACE0_PSEFR|nr:hypothetical protein CJU81_13775 [Pseudomonas fragi]
MPSEQKLKIHIVEGNAACRLFIGHKLALLGHEVVSCDDGKTALAIREDTVPVFDLTITDCNMLPINGCEMTLAVCDREKERGQGDHPIFGLAGNTRSGIIEHCLNARMNQCLLKPVSMKTLIPQVTDVACQIEGRTSAAEAVSGGELQKIKLLKPQAYRPLVDQIIKSHRQEALRLAQMVQDGNFPGLARLAHKLLGGARLADAPVLIEACKTLEELASQESLQECQAQAGLVLKSLRALEVRLLQDR